jgi:Ribosomal silencing factor during starvation
MIGFAVTFKNSVVRYPELVFTSLIGFALTCIAHSCWFILLLVVALVLLLQRLSDILTYALKKRKLYMAPGITGAEGYDCDDWMIVDCWNLIVHVFEAGYRQVGP